MDIFVEAKEKLIGEMHDAQSMQGAMNATHSFIGEVSRTIPMNQYEGEYSVTPNDEVQVLQTTDKVLMQNVVINPIPDNYGLITWTGNTLMVS